MIESLSNCTSYLSWKINRNNYSLFPFTPPHEGLIAPTRNSLTPGAFYEKFDVNPLLEYLSIILVYVGIEAPSSVNAERPCDKYDAAMSLQFIANYQSNRDISQTAMLMSEGANSQCAAITWFYNSLIEIFFGQTKDLKKDERSSLSLIWSRIAECMSIKIEEEITLNYPITEVIPYLKNVLESGQYLIPLASHFVALIKNEKGELYLFDPNQGTVLIDTPATKEWFLSLLKKYRVHLNEELILLKTVKEEEVGNTVFTPTKKTEKKIDETPPELIYETGEGRWGAAVVKWRKETHRLVWDSISNDIYNPDSKKIIRFKNLLLVGQTPLDATIRVIVHLGKMIFNVLVIPLKWDLDRFTERCKIISRLFIDIFRIPLYAVANTCIALYGIINPFDGRRLYTLLESSFNKGSRRTRSYKEHCNAPCFKPWKLDAKTTLQQRLLGYREINAHFYQNLIYTYF